MKNKDLIRRLEEFDPESEVRLAYNFGLGRRGNESVDVTPAVG